jgi:hypothetical protein
MIAFGTGESKTTMGIRDWTIAQAKARFSELIEQARSRGPQAIIERG